MLTIEDVRARVRDAPPRDISALSLCQSLGGVTAWRVAADTATGSWKAREQATGAEVAFHEGTLRDDQGSRQVGSRYRPHPSVALFFPDSLFTWGGENANWVPSWIEDVDDEILVIGLRHVADRSLLASLTFDERTNLFVRFDSPSDSIHMREIQVAESSA